MPETKHSPPVKSTKLHASEASSAERQLTSFLARYTPEIATLAEAVLARLRKLYPTAIELVYDNYNALAIGFSPTERAGDAIFSIALYPKWINFFFLQANGLQDQTGILQGNGRVVKHIRLASAAMLDEPAVRALMKQALALARVPLDPKVAHRLIIKSVSARQRPRRPAAKVLKANAGKSSGRKAAL